MQTTQTHEIAGRTQPVQDPTELNEHDLNDVAGGLLPAVAPASAKGKCPTAVE